MSQIRISLPTVAVLLTALITSNIDFPVVAAGKDSLLPNGINSRASVLSKTLSIAQSQQTGNQPTITKPSLSALPQYFIANTGQVDPQVRYYTKESGQSIYFTAEGVHFVLRRTTDKATGDGHSTAEKPTQPAKSHTPPGALHKLQTDTYTLQSAQLVFLDSNPNPVIEAEQPLAGRVNYLIGNDPDKWHKNIPTYAAVMYRNLYPGIDVRFYRKQGTLEYDVIVAPGADPKQVQFRYKGVDGINLNKSGDLVITLGGGKLVQRKPVVYQIIDGQRNPIEAAFVLSPAPAEDVTSVGFQLATYNPEQPLVIDPVLNFATYLGGGSGDYGNGIAVDNTGRAYVTGNTYSTNFTLEVHGTLSGPSDAFVVRLSDSGSTLDYATYLGGSDKDYSNGIAVDRFGRAYVTGTTYSTDFPATNNSTLSGITDAFVARLSDNGENLEYAIYLGGNDNDDCGGCIDEESGVNIAVDSAERAYVIGITYSDDFSPDTHGTLAGEADVFVARLSNTGTSLEYATYLGGSSFDYGKGIAVDSSGRAYVTGSTLSTDFSPDTHGTLAGGRDAFVARLSSTGASLEYATYLGGSNDDYGYGIAVDSSGRAYVMGSTYSINFPATEGAYQENQNGSRDAFVVRLSENGRDLEYATYLGGSSSDFGKGIAVDSSGRAYVTGSTSTDFPVTDGGIPPSNHNAFVARLSDNGNNLEYATYLGGSNDDYGYGIAVDSTGRIYVVGTTDSTDFPNTIDGSYSGTSDAFVAIFGPPPPISTDPFKASDPLNVAFGQRPVVAFNTVDREFMVAYLVPALHDPENYYELRLQRMDIHSQPIGAAIDPFGGFGALLFAIGRPDIAYSPISNSYLVAVPRVANLVSGDDMVMVLEIKADGTTGIYKNIFEQVGGSLFRDTGPSPVRVTYNSTRNEFLISYQQELHVPPDPITIHLRLLAQLVKPDTTLIGQVQPLRDRTTTTVGAFFDTHSVTYAPVAGGRYVMAVDGHPFQTNLNLSVSYFDADANLILDNVEVRTNRDKNLNFEDYHTQIGAEMQPDLAFGRIEGQDRVLMVWWDADNCRIGGSGPGCSNEEARPGIWGVFLDPAQSVPIGPVGQAFPIFTPAIWFKVINPPAAVKPFMPRVAYNAEGQSFYVAWREIPTLDAAQTGEEVRTHIRGAWVDYYVQDRDDALAAPLHDNVVVSPLSMGNCPPMQWPTCPSIEDPHYPDIAAVDSFGAVVVWEQKQDYDPAGNTLIAGRALVPPAPANDGPTDATDITKTSLKLEGTLLGAGINGVTNCGQADESPDVWYAYTAPSSGVLHLNTCGSHDQFVLDAGIDTVLSLHRPDGSQFDEACNDDAPDGEDETACDSADLGTIRDSALQLVMHQGQTVLARVSRYGGGTSTGAQFLVNNSFEVLADSDSDGYADNVDNCPDIANPEQADFNYDGLGDACSDLDNDGSMDAKELLDNTNPEAPDIRFSLKKGFNLISLPLTLGPVTDLLNMLGDAVYSISYFDPVTGSVITAPDENFNLLEGQAYIIEMLEDSDLLLTGTLEIDTIDLEAGMNYVGFRKVPEGYTAHNLLSSIGDNKVVASVQRFNTVTGRWETTVYDQSGQIGGYDFTIERGEGYLLFLKQQLTGFQINIP